MIGNRSTILRVQFFFFSEAKKKKARCWGHLKPVGTLRGSYTVTQRAANISRQRNGRKCAKKKEPRTRRSCHRRVTGPTPCLQGPLSFRQGEMLALCFGSRDNSSARSAPFAWSRGAGKPARRFASTNSGLKDAATHEPSARRIVGSAFLEPRGEAPAGTIKWPGPFAWANS